MLNFMSFCLVFIILWFNCTKAADTECRTQWEEVTSFVGEQAVMLLKERFLLEMKNCFNISQPQELRLIGKSCKMDSMLNTIYDLSHRAWIPSGYDFVTWYEDKVSCKLDKMAVKHNYSAIDVASFRENSLLDKWTGNSKDLERYKNIFNSCSQNVSGETAFKQVMFIEKCVNLNMIRHCNAIGAKSGLALRVMYSFSTLLEKSPCKSVKLPVQVKMMLEKCMNKSIEEWKEEEVSDEEDLQELSAKDALNFVGDYFSLVVDKTAKCTKMNLGFYNNDTGTTNYTLLADFVKGFSGWENITDKRDVIIDAIKKCSYDDHHTGIRSSTDLLIRMMIEELQFDNCFEFTYASTCGLNSDLAAFFFPIIDTEKIEMFMNHFKTLKKTKLLDKLLMPLMRYLGATIQFPDGAP